MKNRRNFCRFWLEKNDDTDDFLCLKNKNFSTRAISIMDVSIVNPIKTEFLDSKFFNFS